VTVADSDDVVTVHETGHEPVHYFPRVDTRMHLLARSTHHTRCPFKGEASYFHLTVGNRTEQNAVWTYERPYDEAEGLRDRLAFYPDRVDAIEVSEG
jgi:uncharacterized protein (DUF427 family)